MDGQPDCGLFVIGPGDPMTAMGGDVDPVARLQAAGRGFVVKLQLSRTGEQHHPFGLVLIVPEIRRARLSGRNYPLHPHRTCSKKFVKVLGCP